MSTDREEKIRQRAYELWERDGAQHGRDQDYWHEAVEQIDAEESAAKTPKSAPARTRKAAAEKPAAKAATRGRKAKAEGAEDASDRARQAAETAAKEHGYDLSDVMQPEAAAPKKRGRPRKTEGAAEAKAPAKRATRKPKAGSE